MNGLECIFDEAHHWVKQRTSYSLPSTFTISFVDDGGTTLIQYLAEQTAGFEQYDDVPAYYLHSDYNRVSRVREY